jgi:oligopeptide/dipeptide ABC transporter ATP-binding protein
MSGLLEIRDLALSLPVDGESRQILRGVDLSIEAGECVGLVGESGSGKSMTARSVIRLLPDGAESGGSVQLGGDEVMAMSDRELLALRGSRVAMIFQDPRSHIDPIRTVGDHMTEAMCLVADRSRKEARREAATLLESVRLERPDELMGRYPHELSGGMLQRVMIAGALACGPDLLLADEPTTALDVTTQAEVVAILSDLQAERSLGVLFITHDLELATAICDRIAVMYAGEVVEESPAETLHTAPLHPYTSGLLDSRPTLDDDPSPLAVIPGNPISAFEVGEGCPFAPRCRYADAICEREAPPESRLGVGRVRCHHDLAVSATPDGAAP